MTLRAGAYIKKENGDIVPDEKDEATINRLGIKNDKQKQSKPIEKGALDGGKNSK